MPDGNNVVPPVLIEGKSCSQARLQRGNVQTALIAYQDKCQWCQDRIRIFGDHAREKSRRCFGLLLSLLAFFDVATNKDSAMLARTAGEGADVWMSGQGAAPDAQGFLYVITGDGGFNFNPTWTVTR
jgi:hypothetical protein